MEMKKILIQSNANSRFKLQINLPLAKQTSCPYALGRNYRVILIVIT
jgi:hypothetical protein